MDFDDDSFTTVYERADSTPRRPPQVTVARHTPPSGAALGRIALVRAPVRTIGFKR